jgi:hypothetical protein
VETVTVRAARARQLLGVAFGGVMLLVGIGLVPSLAGWVALLLGVIGLVAGLAGIFPGAAYLRFSPDGLTVKYAFVPAHTVPWRAIAGAASELVPLVRHKVPALVLTYAAEYGGRRVGQRLDESHTYVANFTVETSDELAAKANEFRARYGAVEEALTTREAAGSLAAVDGDGRTGEI